MLITGTFKPYVMTYERREGLQHRLTVRIGDLIDHGPWVGLDYIVLYESYDGSRRFVGQALTNQLPSLFEIKPADDEVMTIID
jgi:hypothetical protein